jgi:TolA-binding protein
MSNDAKLTEEQLQKLQGFVSALNQAQMQLGQLEVEKHNLLHQTGEIQGQLQTFQKELEEEYGKVSVNIQDGTYVAIPEEDESNKED